MEVGVEVEVGVEIGVEVEVCGVEGVRLAFAGC